jgi:hypothetical protein
VEKRGYHKNHSYQRVLYHPERSDPKPAGGISTRATVEVIAQANQQKINSNNQSNLRAVLVRNYLLPPEVLAGK